MSAYTDKLVPSSLQKSLVPCCGEAVSAPQSGEESPLRWWQRVSTALVLVDLLLGEDCASLALLQARLTT